MIENPAQPLDPLGPGWCTIVIPCYNEADRLPAASFAHFLARGEPVRFLFVNDGSTDRTLALLEALRAQHPGHIDVLDQQPNAGKAEAVRHGMLAAIARGDTTVTGFWDADLATPLDSIPDLLGRLVHHPHLEMILGSRVKLLGRAIHRDPTRHYLGRVFATVASSMLRLPVYDTQCGAKLFRVTPTLESLLSEPFHSRWIFDVEILARFLAIHKADPTYAAGVIYEQPLQAWRDVAGSKVRPHDFLKAFYELVQLRTRYLR